MTPARASHPKPLEEDPALALEKRAVQYWAMLAERELRGEPVNEANLLYFDDVIDLDEMINAGYLEGLPVRTEQVYDTYQICKFEQSREFARPDEWNDPKLFHAPKLTKDLMKLGYMDTAHSTYAGILHLYWHQGEYDLIHEDHRLLFFPKAQQGQRRVKVMQTIVDMCAGKLFPGIVRLFPPPPWPNRTPEYRHEIIKKLLAEAPVMAVSNTEEEKIMGEFILQNSELLDYELLYGGQP